MGTVKKIDCVRLEGAVRVALEVGLRVGDDRIGVVLLLVNSGQKDESISLAGIKAEGFQGAAFGLRNMTERKLHEPEAILADGRIGRDQETSANQGFGLGEVRAPIKNHGETE